MSENPAPPVPPTDGLVAALVNDAKDGYALLLALIEQSLRLDPSQTEALEAIDRQIHPAIGEADMRLQILLERIAPWETTRNRIAAETAAEVDRFLETLRTGLEGVQSQIARRMEDLAGERDILQTTMARLNQQRQGLGGYRQKSPDPRLFKGEG